MWSWLKRVWFLLRPPTYLPPEPTPEPVVRLYVEPRLDALRIYPTDGTDGETSDHS